MHPRFNVCLAKPEHASELLRIERAAWNESAASLETISKRLSDPAIETILLSLMDGTPAAFIQVLWTTAREIANWGPKWSSVARSPGNPKGDIAYGFNLSAMPTPSAAGAGKLAIEAALGAVLNRRGAGYVAGGRMPGFHAWKNRSQPEVYIGLAVSRGSLIYIDSTSNKTFLCAPANPDVDMIPPQSDWRELTEPERSRYLHNHRQIDPFIRMILDLRCAGVGCRIHGVIDDYFSDPPSCNYGVWYTWQNPFFENPGSSWSTMHHLDTVRHLRS